ncbi:MAG: helix-turn-helix domain-containing protein [Hyphomicrobiaceae bacterium]|nr:helix-turn-helix domain-containing protein [Hyphomicrobiaceae bacterium]
MISIGELARRTATKIPTIRYYEQAGLVPAADRTEGNQRRYGREAVQRLQFVRHCRELGFSLDDIREMILLDADPDLPCSAIHGIAESQLAAVRARISRLKSLERELTRILALPHDASSGQCAVITNLV